MSPWDFSPIPSKDANDNNDIDDGYFSVSYWMWSSLENKNSKRKKKEKYTFSLNMKKMRLLMLLGDNVWHFWNVPWPKLAGSGCA